MKKKITSMRREEAQGRITELSAIMARIGEQGLNLDLSRGKPSMEQLDMVSEFFAEHPILSYMAEDGSDTRNYGIPNGIPEARRLMAELAGTRPENIIVYGESSLELMYSSFVRALLFPLPGQETSWGDQGPIRFLCPAPGYDRHFAMTDALGVEMLPVRMTAQGPDMDQVVALLREDPTIKGMWVVPVYSNPTGATLSDEVIHRLASMEAPDDFLLFYDNAYAAHPVLDEEAPQLPDILQLCEDAGHPSRVMVFASLSKMTYAAAGMAAIGMNEPLRSWWQKHQSFQTIGPNKVNQLMHTRMIRDIGGIRALMKRHQQFLAPRFSLVLDILDQRLGDLGIAEWTHGQGGYFISIDLLPGTAKRTVELAAEVGVQLTPAGSTWPYGVDPEDRNLRLAPSYPDYDDLRPALEVFCLAAELAALEKQASTNTQEN